MTTGNQAIMGSTRMQAATIETLLHGLVLEHVLYRILAPVTTSEQRAQLGFAERHKDLAALVIHATHLPDTARALLPALARIAEAEAKTYKEGGNFFAPDDPYPEKGYALYAAGPRAALITLTDTTERSPTFNTPPFRRQDQPERKTSPVYLALTAPDNLAAWRLLMRRDPRGIEWDKATYQQLMGEAYPRYADKIPRITSQDILRFTLDADTVTTFRPTGNGNLVVGILLGDEDPAPIADVLGRAATTAAIVVRDANLPIPELTALQASIALPRSPLRVEQGIALKIALNTLSTIIMTLLGRVTGNYMTYVTPTNKKLIDRAARLTAGIAGIPYEEACSHIFDAIEATEDDRKRGRGVPPLVNIAVVAARRGLSPKEAVLALNRHNGMLAATLEE
jgi:N-acetylmuramic acid 6-phosphate etherase